MKILTNKIAIDTIQKQIVSDIWMTVATKIEIYMEKYNLKSE